jgi:hypothetical protein
MMKEAVAATVLAWAVVAYAVIVVFLYVVLDIVPSTLRKRREHPDGDMAHEREDD